MYLAIISIIVSVLTSTFITVFLIHRISNPDKVIKNLKTHVQELNKSLSRVANQQVAMVESKISELKKINAGIARRTQSAEHHVQRNSNRKIEKNSISAGETPVYKKMHPHRNTRVSNTMPENTGFTNKPESKIEHSFTKHSTEHSLAVNAQVRDLLKEGYSTEAIAKKLSIAQAHIELVRSLHDLE